ncbi:hypothetical protein LPJ60_000581 [Coemansia sp. RSA 2675]|nr:hypothetical protein LPJ60_000581 [Coemansia sp. RSA 2675]KAJ1998020.1 hypothetical protein GGI06_006347 [Coemansia sp. S85]KAJ2696297.1 hypothetical protein H4218_004682 [Coemansia sp. IMI 209128]
MNSSPGEKEVVQSKQHTVEEWSALFVGKRLVEYPKDAKPEPIKADHDAGTKMEDAEPEGQAPKVDEPTDDEDDEGSSDAAEKAKKRQIKWAELPQPVRVIWPGTRVTRDLRPNRLNVICTADDLITKVQFF